MMTDQDNTKIATEANRKAWDISAKHHRDTDKWHDMVSTIARPDFSCFSPTMTTALKRMQLAGKSVIQVGCNNGREVFSLPSFGVKNALGIDQSGGFIEQAHELAKIAQKPVDFIRADIYNLPPDTPCGFDAVMITIGMLNWMPDLPKFFTIIAGLLADDGRLIIYETHPFLEMFNPKADDPFHMENSYFETSPWIETEVITYDASTPEGGVESYWFSHSLSHIMTSVLGAGLRITGFEEFAHNNREVDYAVYENQSAQLPMCYILQAAKG